MHLSWKIAQEGRAKRGILTKQRIYDIMRCFCIFTACFMYDYIQISKINDFLFCPHSLYFHSVYEGFDDGHYKARPQIAGRLAHATVDCKTAEGRKTLLQGMEVFSEQYGIVGKIDLFDIKTGELIERKRTIKKVHEGYRFQLWAQKCCLEEMGHRVQKMTLHSLTDNKKYDVTMDTESCARFEETLVRMRGFHPLHVAKTAYAAQCENCIYRELCKKTI